MTGRHDVAHWCGACTAHVLLAVVAMALAAVEAVPWTVTVTALALAGGLALLLCVHQDTTPVPVSHPTDWTDQ